MNTGIGLIDQHFEQITRHWQERATVTNQVLRRFRNKPFSWEGSANCVHLARAQMAAFGHQVPVVPKFRSPLGAKKAMAKRGFADLAAMMDAYALRISPAEMWPGDIAMLPGDEMFDALVISDGHGMVLGWHGSDLSGLKAIKLNKADRILAAWRV